MSSECESDTAILRDEFGMQNVLGAVPTGVDCDYFQPNAQPAAKPVLAFLGAMDWDANQDAVLWLIEAILPRVWEQVPETEFRVIGRNPPARMQALSAAEPRIRFTGTVPDVRPFMREATAMVLPLRIGGGTRIKIYEAMAMGVPVVSTAIGAEGLDVQHDRNILLADTAEDFAKATLLALTNSPRAAEIARAAREHVAANYSWSRVAKIFSDYCADTISAAADRLARSSA
jgi:polysaccharide biosynthesis protein PslH